MLRCPCSQPVQGSEVGQASASSTMLPALAANHACRTAAATAVDRVALLCSPVLPFPPAATLPKRTRSDASKTFQHRRAGIFEGHKLARHCSSSTCIASSASSRATAPCTSLRLAPWAHGCSATAAARLRAGHGRSAAGKSSALALNMANAVPPGGPPAPAAVQDKPPMLRQPAPFLNKVRHIERVHRVLLDHNP